MQKNIDIDDGDFVIGQQVPILGQHLFFQNLIDVRQLPDIKTGVPVRAQQGHDQGFNGRM